MGVEGEEAVERATWLPVMVPVSVQAFEEAVAEGGGGRGRDEGGMYYR